MKLYNYVKEHAPIDFKELGINKKSYFKVKQYVEKLNNILSNEISKDDHSASDDILIKASFSAMKDLVFFKGSYEEYILATETDYSAVICRSSNCNRVSRYLPKVVFGFPKDIELSWKSEVLHLVTLCSEISMEELASWAPEFYKRNLGEIILQQGYFNEYLTQEEVCSYYGYTISSEVKEIINPDLLREKIEQLEAEKAALERRKLLETSIQIGGAWYVVNNHRVNITDDIINDSTLPLEYLFKGEKVELQYEGYYSTNLNELRNSILRDELNYKIQDIISSKKLVSPGKLRDIIKTSLDMTISVELAGITMTDKIYQYIEKDERGQLYIVLYSEKREDYEKQKLEVFKDLFKEEAEKKFSKKAFYFVKGKRKLTNKGAKALSYYNDEKAYVLSELTLSNYEESMEYLEMAYEEAKKMLG